jgi:hypothetical protein
MDRLFEATINDFILVPCVRMTAKGKWGKRARRYLQNKEDLAILLKLEHKPSPNGRR